jgi:hypothetical protein
MAHWGLDSEQLAKQLLSISFPGMSRDKTTEQLQDSKPEHTTQEEFVALDAKSDEVIDAYLAKLTAFGNNLEPVGEDYEDES